MKRLITITYETEDSSAKNCEGDILLQALEVLNRIGAGDISMQTSDVCKFESSVVRDQPHREIEIPDFIGGRKRIG